MAAETFEALLKVVIIGDTSVGKTCIILRYTQDMFRDNFLSTIGEWEVEGERERERGRGSWGGRRIGYQTGAGLLILATTLPLYEIAYLVSTVHIVAP